MRRVLRRVFMESLPRTSREPDGSTRPAPRTRALLSLVPLEDRVVPTTFTVINTADAGTGSLRAQIGQANTGDTVNFDPTLFATPQTINLTSGQITIAKSITVTGPGQSLLTVAGSTTASATNRIFLIDDASTTTSITVGISNMKLTGANLNSSFAAAGAVQTVNENVTLTKVTISGCTATSGYGGALAETGAATYTLDGCTITGNTAYRGGAYDDPNLYTTGGLTIRNSTFSNNTSLAGSGGGALSFYWTPPTVVIQNSTFSGNTTAGSAGGGAIYFYGTSTTSTALISNSTFTGNSTTYGSGSVGGAIVIIAGSGSYTIQNSTITGNTAGGAGGGNGGGICVSSNSGTIAISSTVIAGNTRTTPSSGTTYGIGADFKNGGTGAVTLDHDFFGSGTGFTLSGTANNTPGTDAAPVSAQLGTLANNGGPTFTVAPLAASPLLNAGTANGYANDQRGPGFARVFGSAADIGAVEQQTAQGSVVSIVPNSPSPTNVSPLSFTVTLDQSVTGLTASNFTLTATGLTATIASVVPNATASVYTVTTSAYAGTGTLQLKLVNGNNANPALSNPNTPAATSPVVQVDTVSPVFTSLTYGGTTPTNAGTLMFTAVFSEPVSLTAANFVVTRGGTLAGGTATVTATATPGTYTLAVTTGTGDGPLTVALPNFTGVTDPAGNTVLGTAPAPITVTVDKTAPTLVGITAVAPTTTNANQVQYTVTFSEAVQNLAASNFTVAATGSLTGVSIGAPVATATPGVYTVPVNSLTGDGTITLTLANAGTVKDAAGNAFVLAAPVSGPAFTVVRSNAVLGIDPAGPALTNATVVNETVRFNVAVTNLTAANFAAVTSSGLTGTVGTPVSAAPDNKTYTVPVTVTGNGTLQLRFVGGLTTSPIFVNNPPYAPVPFTGTPVTVDQKAPSVVGFTRLDPAATHLASVRYQVVFDEPVLGLKASNFAVVSSDGAAAGAPTLTGSGTTYVVTVPSGATNGTVRLDLANSAAAGDAAGNAVAGLPRQGDPYTLYVVPPRITSIALAGPASTSADQVQFKVTFSQPVTNVTLGNFALAATTGGSGLLGVTGSGSDYTVTAATGNGDGIVGLTLMNPAGIVDVTGQSVVNTFVGPSYSVVKSPPRVVGFTAVTPAATNGGTAEFTLTFDQPVAGVDASDFVVSAPGVAGASVLSVTGSGTTYDLVLSLGSGDGTVRPDLVDDDSIVSAVSGLPLGGTGVGNGNFSGPTIAVNRTGPTVAVAPAPGQPTTVTLDAAGNAGPLSFAVTFSAPVTGFTADGVFFAGPGGFVTVSGSGANYVVTVNSAAGAGTFTVGVKPGAGFDAVGNPSFAGNAASVTTVAPVPPPVVTDPTPLASADGFATQTNRPLAVGAASGVLANDISPVGSGLTAVLLAAPPASQGVLALDPDGGFRFTPARGFLGATSFTYAARDAAGNTSAPAVATVRVGSRTTFTAVAAGPGGGPMVTIYNADGTVLRDFFAYDPSFTGGVRVAVGDINGDGVDDIVTAAGPGGAAHIRAFDARTGAVLRNFFAYDPSFTGGAYVAVGDVDGDGYGDIVTGAGAGGGPHVQVFSGLTGQSIKSFFAYVPEFTGGVQVAVGDITGEGKADIVTGAVSGGSHVQAFDGATGAQIRNFFAFDPTQTGGVTIAVGDVNNDGKADIVTGSGADARVRLYDGQSPKLLNEKSIDIPFLTGGVRVAVGDSTGSGQFDRLLVVPAGSAAPTVRRYTLPGVTPVDAVSDFPADFFGGLYVG